MFLLYGANGYTGKLAARTALEEGLEPILAGRSAEKVRAVAEPLGLPWRAFDPSDGSAAREALGDVPAVLSMAGPFAHTADAMVDVCLASGTHYLDITAEMDVFSGLQDRDRAAREAGVMLLPGVGAGGAPTDCLAAHLKARMPDACWLELAATGFQKVSRGTAKQGVEAIGEGIRVRRDGRLVELGAPVEKTFELPDGSRHQCLSAPLADVVVAWHSTGIENITTYMEAFGDLRRMLEMPGWLRRLLATAPAQRFLKSRIDRWPEGPTDEERASGGTRTLGIAGNRSGKRASSLLRAPEGYTLTVRSALAAARRTAGGEATPGYQTPSTAFGASFIETVPGCSLEDLE